MNRIDEIRARLLPLEYNGDNNPDIMQSDIVYLLELVDYLAKALHEVKACERWSKENIHHMIGLLSAVGIADEALQILDTHTNESESA